MICRQCSQSFSISDEESDFYARVAPVYNGKTFALPTPTLCPDCRTQRRMVFRNFFNLYQHTSALSGKRILSMYPPDAPFPIYEMHEWWGDTWSALDYGLTIDPSRTAFQHMKELSNTVPRMNISNTQTENTDFCNFSFNSRNCYLIFGNVSNEDCCYGHIVWQSKNCFDCLYVYRSELCYECTDCVDCYNVHYSVNADHCHESQFLRDCVGCKSCFGCVGLRNKENYIFNEYVSRKDYPQRVKEFYIDGRPDTARIEARIAELRNTEIVKFMHGFGCENVSGDYLYNSKNTFNSFDVKNCEDCRHCTTLESFSDCADCNFSPAKTELSYNCLTIFGYHLLMCHSVGSNSSNLLYCDNCFACKDCFGCFDLKSQQYCIYNTQYSKAEYEKSVSSIIEGMQHSGDWGEFFPADFSPFSYNETIAQEYFPLSKKVALQQGYSWKEETTRAPQEQLYQVPTRIEDVHDDILAVPLVCISCARNYKINPQELQHYRAGGFPIPLNCFFCRHAERLKLRNPRQLFQRECDSCSIKVATTYAPERPEQVYCEPCYLKTL